MSKDITQNLYASMPDRIASCIRTRGGSTGRNYDAERGESSRRFLWKIGEWGEAHKRRTHHMMCSITNTTTVASSLEVRSGDSFQAEQPTSSSVSTTKSRKKAKRHKLFWIKKKITGCLKWETLAGSTTSDLLKHMETALKDRTPSELFEQFYSSEMYHLIVKGIMPYAADVINKIS
ncbi:uncharacterized protein TNCV_1747621 [Trichonephila clavipes]|nr:uncharacterized protein TNCV_1747621 [Trichonephila clavipes]